MSDNIPRPTPYELAEEHRRVRMAMVGGYPAFMVQWNAICTAQEGLEAKWCIGLRAIGIKAAHPENGWIDRVSSETHDAVKLVDAYFNDGVRVGDMIAIGDPEHYRVRKVTGIKSSSFLEAVFSRGAVKYLVRK